MPNALRVSVNLPNPVKRDSVDLSSEIGELEHVKPVPGKGHFS
jgi:hypothetical protein